MADNDTDDVVMDDELEGGGSAGKKWLLVMFVLLLLAGAGAGAYFFLLQGDSSTEVSHSASHESVDGEGAHEDKSVDEAAATEAAPVFYELPQFLVNLNTGGAKARFLKMTATVELETEEELKIIESHQPRIVDSVNTYLRELRASDLSGSAGLQRLREELIKRINQYISPAKVKNILFTEIVVQ